MRHGARLEGGGRIFWPQRTRVRAGEGVEVEMRDCIVMLRGAGLDERCGRQRPGQLGRWRIVTGDWAEVAVVVLLVVLVAVVVSWWSD